MQVMLLQYAHLVLELRQQLPSGHERPEQIPPKLDALRSAISVSTPQHRPAAITLDAGFGQHAPKLATPSGAPVSMMHGVHVPDAVQADLPQPREQVLRAEKTAVRVLRQFREHRRHCLHHRQPPGDLVEVIDPHSDHENDQRTGELRGFASYYDSHRRPL